MTSDLAEYVEHFRARVLQDALAEATRTYWLRRAQQFANALPRTGDYLGRESEVERRRRVRALVEVIRACHARAGVSPVMNGIICPVCQTPTSPWSCSCGETRVGEVA